MPEPDLLLKTRKWQKWHWVTLGYVRKGDTASAWLSLWGYLFLEPSCWTVKSPVPLAEVTGKILADSPSLRSQGTAKHEGASRWVSPSYHKILSKNRTAELSETIVTITKTIMTVILTNTCFSFKLLALSDLYYSSGEGNGTPLQYSGKSHGRRSLVGCCPWGREQSDTTERLPFHFSLSCIGEGNGNPLQCSCLENPRTREPGGLASMGSHRVGHDWSDLAAAAAVDNQNSPQSWKRRWT